MSPPAAKRRARRQHGPAATAAPRKVDIVTDWEPHSAGQRAVLVAPEQIIDLTCGRRWGKSDVIQKWLTGIHPDGSADLGGAVWVPDSRNFYTAPQRLPNCKEMYDACKNALGDLVIYTNDSDLTLRLFNRASIEFKTLERPDNLRGLAFDRLAMDEKGTTQESAWTHVLAPILADPPTRCTRKVLRAGTPRGRRHWTYREHMASLESPRGPGGRAAFTFPTWARPGTEALVEEMRRSLPHNVFAQEIGAEFLADAAGYFQELSKAYDGRPAPAKPDTSKRHTFGIDLPHTEDWGVIIVVEIEPNRTMRVVHMTRWSRAPWPVTKSRAVEVFKAWNADGLIDSTPGGAPGEVTVEAFAPEWRRIDGFDFRQGAGREDLLANLAIGLEGGQIKLPGTPDAPAFPTLAAELEGFQYEILPSGRARARAGPGLNDDCVMALALAAWKARNLGGYASRKHF